MAITLGGGGSASQINEVVTLNNTANTVTLADGRVYLKGGVVETNLSTYPLASSSIQQIGSFSVGAQDTSPRGIAWDGTHFWVTGNTNARVYKYNSAGVYQNVSFYTGSQTGSPLGITWDGTYFYVLGNNTLFKYSASGVYLNTAYTVNADNMQDVTWDGTHFWVVGYSGDAVYKYTAAGVNTGVSFSVAAQQTEPYGITWDGTYFWVSGYQGGGAVNKYNASGVYQNENFEFPANNVGGLEWDGSAFWLVKNAGDTVSKMGPALGVTSAQPNGGQNYVRVA